MTARQPAPAETPHRDPVRDEARATALRALANHQGIIRSLPAQRLQEVVGMDAGPTREVGRPPQAR
jgi:hypothetical protein